MNSQHRKYAAADMKQLPWPQPIPKAREGFITRWVMAFDWQLTGEDAGIAVDRVRLQDPSLDMNLTLKGDLMVITFTWRERYDADALSRSSAALQLITRVVGRPVQLLGRATDDWPFLR